MAFTSSSRAYRMRDAGATTLTVGAGGAGSPLPFPL
eukprot:CAMPEP_0119497234 /NCGR_PEP_ID=MMETSP1344-20130328/20336_1 /TAXON_ID=236787 /ORGANISM="Florenciella parvula, Strain CCMP2471" /LENGTH=35 /DNA_ID= /DNA_START= /DNA_END= /DNA_ORIENTATION=